MCCISSLDFPQISLPLKSYPHAALFCMVAAKAAAYTDIDIGIRVLGKDQFFDGIGHVFVKTMRNTYFSAFKAVLLHLFDDGEYGFFFTAAFMQRLQSAFVAGFSNHAYAEDSGNGGNSRADTTVLYQVAEGFQRKHQMRVGGICGKLLFNLRTGSYLINSSDNGRFGT